MSAKAGNVLPPGTSEFEFKGQRLHGYLTDLTDDIQWRVAVHEFDRRDGAQTEVMGRAPMRLQGTLVFAGVDDASNEQAFLDAQAFVLALEVNPSGLLVHPIYGKRQMTCSGTQGARLAVPEVNTYTLPVSFIENNLDGSVIGEQTQGPAVKAAAVQAQSANVLLLAAVAPGAAAQVQALTTAAVNFATNAAASSAGAAVDPSLITSLNGLPPLTATAIASLRSSASAPEVAAAVTACEVLLALCSQLGDALLIAAPSLQPWTVPADMPLVVVAERFYGGDAFAHLDEITTNNPGILGLVLIPAGTQLRLAAATV